MGRKTVLALVGVAMAATPILMSAGPAAAWTATCSVGFPGDSCIYYNQSYGGAHGGEDLDVKDFSPAYYYFANGAGAGTRVWNNNGSDRNLDTGCSLGLYYSKDFGPPLKTLSVYGAPGYQAAGSGLGSLLNNVRSQQFCI